MTTFKCKPSPIIERLGWHAIPDVRDLRVGLDPDEGIKNFKDWSYANAVVGMLTHPDLGKMKPEYADYAGRLWAAVQQTAHLYGRTDNPTEEGVKLYSATAYIDAVMRHYAVDLNAIERECGIDPKTLTGYISGGVEPHRTTMTNLVEHYPVPGARIPHCWMPERLKLTKIKKKVK